MNQRNLVRVLFHGFCFFLVTLCTVVTTDSLAQTPKFFNLIEGTPLDFTGLKETETEQVKSFKADGKNPYNGDAEAIKKGDEIYQGACGGCHGHKAEGKIGPGLADSHWTYKAATKDPGLFSAIFGGLSGSMGPQRGRLSQDEILHVMAWLRSIAGGGAESKDAAGGGTAPAADASGATAK